jgi:hypothetical protein
MTLPARFLALALTFVASTALAAAPISLHPENPHYFQFRGKPAILVTSGEHYGAVLNLKFDFLPYLDELKSRGFNLTRVFSGTYREIPGSFNIKANTLAPEPGQFCGPYARTNTPGAADGGAKFDLDRWNPDYFARLATFCKEAGARGIVVEFVLFCPFYEESLWAVNAWNPKNNVNDSPNIPSKEVYTLKHPKVVERQLAFVRKVVAELNPFDNVYFEICNEPYFGGVTLDWQAKVAATIVATEKPLPNRHMIAQNIANESAKIENPNPAVSLFNFHYARPPKTVALNYGLNKALGDDETGFQGTGDFVYRAEAWDFLIAGGSLFSHLDYSFTTDHEDGSSKVVAPTPGGGGPEFRAQLAYLKTFLEGVDFLKMKPDDTVIACGPGGTTARALSVPGQTYAIYVKGRTRTGLTLNLPDGSYRYEWHDPKGKKIVKEGTTTGGRITLEMPNTSEDAALKVITTNRR